MSAKSKGLHVLTVGCQGCPVRNIQCDDCFVTLLSGEPGSTTMTDSVGLDSLERYAVSVLANAGMIGHAEAARLEVTPLRRVG
jgi:hypothetical protein